MRLGLSLIFCIFDSHVIPSLSLSAEGLWSRPDFFRTTLSTFATTALAPTLPPPTRTVDVGGGVDLLSPNVRLTKPDVFFPVSMEGLWTCERVVNSVDGDTFQANAAWKALGGPPSINLSSSSSSSSPSTTLESYLTRFLPSPYTGELASYTVLDRRFEYKSRTGLADVDWQVDQPDFIQTPKFQLNVVWRIVELPNDQGFGSQELWKITDGPFLRAALVKRRFRRNFDSSQNRIVEGLEVIKTFRVLDGVAGTEFPTSTVRSLLRLSRPRGDANDVPSGAY